jgi:hypothetical protein
MALKTQSEDQRLLEAPDNATRTSDYEISGEARAAYLAALDEAVDDLMIGLQIRVRDRPDADDQVELDDFIRQQGHDPADFEA